MYKQMYKCIRTRKLGLEFCCFNIRRPFNVTGTAAKSQRKLLQNQQNKRRKTLAKFQNSGEKFASKIGIEIKKMQHAKNTNINIKFHGK